MSTKNPKPWWPRDANERGAGRYSQHATLCEAPRGKWGCTRKPGHKGDHIASDQVRVQARWQA